METDLYELDIPLPRSWDEFTSEQLYWMVANRRDLIDDDTISACVDILSSRIMGWCVTTSRSFWSKFSWRRNDVYLDVLEHLWGIICRRSIRGERSIDISEGVFPKYFMKSYKGHLLKLYRDQTRHNPTYKGDVFLGYNGDKKPVYMMCHMFDSEYIERLKANERRWAREYRERRKGGTR